MYEYESEQDRESGLVRSSRPLTIAEAVELLQAEWLAAQLDIPPKVPQDARYAIDVPYGLIFRDRDKRILVCIGAKAIPHTATLDHVRQHWTQYASDADIPSCLICGDTCGIPGDPPPHHSHGSFIGKIVHDSATEVMNVYSDIRADAELVSRAAEIGKAIREAMRRHIAYQLGDQFWQQAIAAEADENRPCVPSREDAA